MRLSRQLNEALKVPTPYEMHVKYGMVLPHELITKGRKGVEAKGPRLILSRPDGKWRIEAMVQGVGEKKKTLEDKKKAMKLARRIVGQLRDYGDDFVVHDGRRTWRVQGGDTLAFSRAQQAVKSFFRGR